MNSSETALCSLKMDQIQHKYVDSNGVKIHIAEIGTGPQLSNHNVNSCVFIREDRHDHGVVEIIIYMGSFFFCFFI